MSEAQVAAPTSAPSVPAPKAEKKTTGVEAKQGGEAPKTQESPFKSTKHKVVIDGAEAEIDYDELRNGYQREKASQKRFEEAKQIKQAATELIQGLGKGDEKAWGWLKANVPKDVFKKVAFDFAYQELEYDSLPDDKKRELTLNEREQKLKELEEAREKETKQAQWQAEVKTAGDTIQKQIDEFVERSGVKPSSEQLYRMSEYMIASLRKTGELPKIDDLHKYVDGQLDMDALGVIKRKASDVESFKKWLPPDILKALKKSFIEESVATQPKRYESDGKTVSARKEPKRLGIDEAFAKLEKTIRRR